jgi:hypothetical protein
MAKGNRSPRIFHAQWSRRTVFPVESLASHPFRKGRGKGWGTRVFSLIRGGLGESPGALFGRFFFRALLCRALIRRSFAAGIREGIARRKVPRLRSGWQVSRDDRSFGRAGCGFRVSRAGASTWVTGGWGLSLLPFQQDATSQGRGKNWTDGAEGGTRESGARPASAG